MSWRYILALVIAVSIGIGGIVYWQSNRRPENHLQLPGVIEIQEVRLGSKIGGRVADVLVREGDVAQPGQLLVKFAVPELEAQREQQEGRLAAVEATLLRARNGSRPEEIDEAKSDLESSEADLKQAEADFMRVDRLFKEGTLTRADWDLARAARDRLKGKVASSRAHYELIRLGSRAEDIALAEANVVEARGKLNEINANLAEANVTAPERAVIEVVAVRKGDLVGPNTPVVRVLRAADIWVRVYVPETMLGRIRLGQPAKVTIDAFPGRQFSGTVFQIASESEYTPRNVQSLEERRYQVFGVKIRIDDTDGVFKAGMAAQVGF
jgi:multidrug resistance efflux pump